MVRATGFHRAAGQVMGVLPKGGAGNRLSIASVDAVWHHNKEK